MRVGKGALAAFSPACPGNVEPPSHCLRADISVIIRSSPLSGKGMRMKWPQALRLGLAAQAVRALAKTLRCPPPALLPSPSTGLPSSGNELLPFSSTFGGVVLWVLGNVRLGHCGGKRKARLASRGRMREQAEEQIYSPWRGHVFRNAHDLRTSHGGSALGTPGPRLPDHRVGSAVAGILAGTPAPAIPNRATDLKGTGASWDSHPLR